MRASAGVQNFSKLDLWIIAYFGVFTQRDSTQSSNSYNFSFTNHFLGNWHPVLILLSLLHLLVDEAVVVQRLK